ncbi:translation initiation factor IF-2 [Candidatus Parcubacteria bacterium]|nr:MAG: translation initiation factor IF-2 [Candidatus Parcubacteria bacterium]
MNITELARILKITPGELKEILPKLGFDIGAKAIKINKSVASKIIKEWPTLRRKMQIERELEMRQARKKEAKQEVSKKITVPSHITVRDFATKAGLQINSVLTSLMKNGIFASLNEKIDYDTAWLVGSELGIEVSEEKNIDKNEEKDNTLQEILDKEEKHKLLERPPVIVVMGHVDHGKTKLLDSIRKSQVVEGEAGGITQHIGAYQVERKGQTITFIDTPGHEAFTAMRSRGAKIADVAILVVAADDGVKPQTVEAFRIIEASGVPFVVAINKIDKPEANIDNVKQELSNQLNLIPEDWGGKTICSSISALKGEGINELLDVVLLLAETEADNIKANPEAPAVGTIIESHVDKGAGPVATILVQNGTLKAGDQLMFDNINIGKVRCLNDYNGEKAELAGPYTPAQIIGLKKLPAVGDIVQVGTGQKIRHKKIRSVTGADTQIRSAHSDAELGNAKLINVIIKSDVLGSAEAIEESLEKINTEKVKVRIVKKGLGNITDGDVKQAEASGAKIIGFNIKSSHAIEDLARERGVSFKLYNIIYDLINDLKAEMKELAGTEIVRKDLGTMNVLAIFKTDAKNQIVGGKIKGEQIKNNSLVDVIRNDKVISFGKISAIRCGKEEVSQVSDGQECGVTYEGDPIVQVGDILQFYVEESEG